MVFLVINLCPVVDKLSLDDQQTNKFICTAFTIFLNSYISHAYLLIISKSQNSDETLKVQGKINLRSGLNLSKKKSSVAQNFQMYSANFSYFHAKIFEPSLDEA